MDAAAPEARRSEVLVACGMATGLSVVLHSCRLFMLPHGGSVTLASALPIWVVARRYGLRAGFAAGACTGIASFLINPVVVHPLQPLLDYPLAFGMLGLAALTRSPGLGAALSTVARFAVQVASGLVFFAHTFPKAFDPLAWSMIYNLYLLPDMVIALALLRAVQARAPQLLGISPESQGEKPAAPVSPMLFAGPLLMVLLGIGAVAYSLGTILPALTAEKTNTPPSPANR